MCVIVYMCVIVLLKTGACRKNGRSHIAARTQLGCPLEMFWILLIRTWVALSLSEHGGWRSSSTAMKSESQGTSDAASPLSMHPFLPPSSFFLLLGAWGCHSMWTVHSSTISQTHTSRPPSWQTPVNHSSIVILAHAWSDTCAMSDGDTCAGKQHQVKKQWDIENKWKHCFCTE